MYRKSAYVLLMALGFCLAANGQKTKTVKCNVQLDNAPKLRGFYLGQKENEIRNIVYKGKPQTEREILLGGYFVSGDMDASKATEQTSGYEMKWDFYNEKVMAMSLGYVSYLPNDISQFAREHAMSANFPEGVFDIKSTETAEAKCNGFSVILSLAKASRSSRSPKPLVIIEDRKAVNAQIHDQFLNRPRVTTLRTQ